MRNSLKKISIISVLLLVGCGLPVTDKANNNNIATQEASAGTIDVTLFDVVSHQSLKGITGDTDDQIYVLQDKETGKKFVLYKGYHKGNLVEK